MRAYCLPDPSPMEKRLLKRVSGSMLERAEWKTFPSGEIHVRVGKPPKKVAVIGRTHPPADNFLRTLLLVDSLRRNGASDIVLVLPYFAYARQDRRIRPGDPLSPLAILASFKAVGARRVVTLDLHSRRVADSSPLPITSVSAVRMLAGELKDGLRGREFTVLAPDRGAADRAALFARALGGKPAVIWAEKKRDPSGRLIGMRLNGYPRGGAAVIVDDMLDTGGTVRKAVGLLRRRGVGELYLCVTHPIFSGRAARLIARLGFRRIVAADALPAPAAGRLRGFKTVRSDALLSGAVKRSRS